MLPGIGSSIVPAWLFYRGALKIDQSKFFTWTGGMLVVVAAGVPAFDIGSAIPPDSWYGSKESAPSGS